MNPTNKQIGGTHYKTAIQPVQYIYANNLNFFEGNVIKYITRHRSKGGKADLEKAIHYIEMLMEFEYSEKTAKDKNDPANYNVKKQTLCNNCIFSELGENAIIGRKCSVGGTKLSRYCIDENIIYTSLKQ